MATASSAQREPSMEEILASIRRIIEDNDTGKKPGDGEAFRLARHRRIGGDRCGRLRVECQGNAVDGARDEIEEALIDLDTGAR